jgi:DNA invertase Pin-like site-specific DNA recombinase
LDQWTERQRECVTLELDRAFEDKASGKSMDRPELKKALDYVRDGDTLVCHSIDRLAHGKSYQSIGHLLPFDLSLKPPTLELRLRPDNGRPHADRCWRVYR